MCCLIIWVNAERFEAERTRIRHKYNWLLPGPRWRKLFQRTQNRHPPKSKLQTETSSSPSQQLHPSNLPTYEDTFVQVQEGDLDPQPPNECEKSAGHLN
jgi:hypothetical protein